MLITTASAFRPTSLKITKREKETYNYRGIDHKPGASSFDLNDNLGIRFKLGIIVHLIGVSSIYNWILDDCVFVIFISYT